MPWPLPILILLPVGYLIGGIPWGLVVGKANGIDPRKEGSGNIGATNVGRLLGRKYFWLVFWLDMAKGALPPGAAGALLHWHSAGNPLSADDYLLWLAVAAATFIGSLFSPYIGFKGGKGVATSIGVMAGVFPYLTLPGVVVVATFGTTVKLSGYVSLGSIFGAAIFVPALVVIGLLLGWPVFSEQWPLLALAGLMSLAVIVRHRANIQRLLAGTETKVSKSRAA